MTSPVHEAPVFNPVNTVTIWGTANSWIVERWDENGKCCARSAWMDESTARTLHAAWSKK